MGVRYQLVDRKTAILNAVPTGVFVVEVIADSPAESAGVKEGDILTKIDGQTISEDNGLAEIISLKKIGDQIELEIYRDGETQKLSLTLVEASQ